MCCEPIDRTDDGSEIDGECSDCGQPTVDGEAAYGCFYSSVECKTCGWKPCDGSC